MSHDVIFKRLNIVTYCIAVSMFCDKIMYNKIEFLFKEKKKQPNEAVDVSRWAVVKNLGKLSTM